MSVAAPVQTLTFTRSINAPIEQVYRSFTNSDWYCYWLCDDCRFQAKEGGSFYFSWFADYYAFGVVNTLKENEHVALTWRGKGDTNDTRIAVDFKEMEGAVHLSLTLTDFAPEAADTVKSEWEKRLDALKAMLESGEDQRITQRVLVGVYPGEFNEKIAEKLGVPIKEGMRIDGAIPDLSAAAAGLQKDDVIVEVAGRPVQPGQPVVTPEMKVGDVVEVVYYRGPEKHTVSVTLKGYPIPAVPADFAGMADRAQEIYAGQDKELTEIFAGVSEETASRKPGPEEWNAKEVVAHLILNERWFQGFLGGYAQGPEIEGYSCNHPARIGALVNIYPTAAEITAELRRAWAETVALLRGVPAEVAARKSFLWWASFEVNALINHTNGHFDQIRAALKA